MESKKEDDSVPKEEKSLTEVKTSSSIKPRNSLSSRSKNAATSIQALRKSSIYANEIGQRYMNTDNDGLFTDTVTFNKQDHLEYESLHLQTLKDEEDLPRFSIRSTMLESIVEEKDSNLININIYNEYENKVKCRFSNLEDHNFDLDYNKEGTYDQSISIDTSSFTKGENLNEDHYMSISSNSIISNNQNDYFQRSQVIEEDAYAYELDLKNISNVFMKKNYIIIYFELHYFMLWNLDFIKAVYPENNLIMVFTINDDITTSEKICLVRKEDKKYVPLIKKDDLSLNKRCYRVIKYIPDLYDNKSNSLNLNAKPIKISVEICNYSNNKLLPVSQDEYFFSPYSENEMHKYHIYQNTYMKHNNKKMGNILFNFMFKLDRLNFTSESSTEIHNKYMHMFSRKGKLITYKEESELQLIYYHIPNNTIKLQGNNTSNNNERNLVNFNSLKDIKEVDLDGELKSHHTTLERLLEILNSNYIYKKYELFDLLKKLHDFVSKKDFDEEKIQNFKEKLYKIIDETKDNKDCYDKCFIPFLFILIRKLFFRVVKAPTQKDLKTKKNPDRKKSSSTPNFDNKYMVRNQELMQKIFEISFNFIKPDMGPNLSLGALNFIYKNIEEKQNEDTYLSYIIDNKKYHALCDLLLYMSEEAACALPITGIIMKIFKSRKEESKELVSIIKQDKFKEVFKQMISLHDSNCIIMTNIVGIFFNILDAFEIEEMFQILNFFRLRNIFVTFRHSGFETIHENIIYFLKAALVKKSSSKNQNSKALDDNDYAEMICIFSNAVKFIKEKIAILDFVRCIKSMHNYLSHLYTICNIINNINTKNAENAYKVCIKENFTQMLIECLNAISEKKIFQQIDNAYDKFDTNSVNLKTIIFRTLFHCMTLIQTLKGIKNDILVKY